MGCVWWCAQGSRGRGGVIDDPLIGRHQAIHTAHDTISMLSLVSVLSYGFIAQQMAGLPNLSGSHAVRVRAGPMPVAMANNPFEDAMNSFSDFLSGLSKSRMATAGGTHTHTHTYARTRTHTHTWSPARKCINSHAHTHTGHVCPQVRLTMRWSSTAVILTRRAATSTCLTSSALRRTPSSERRGRRSQCNGMIPSMLPSRPTLQTCNLPTHARCLPQPVPWRGVQTDTAAKVGQTHLAQNMPIDDIRRQDSCI